MTIPTTSKITREANILEKNGVGYSDAGTSMPILARYYLGLTDKIETENKTSQS